MSDDFQVSSTQPALNQYGAVAHPPDMFLIGCLAFAILVLAAGVIFSYLDVRRNNDD